MKLKLQMRMNGIRRWIVKQLLGQRLIVEKYETPQGIRWQLIDEKRRIPYGWVWVVPVDDRDFRIIL